MYQQDLDCLCTYNLDLARIILSLNYKFTTSLLICLSNTYPRMSKIYSNFMKMFEIKHNLYCLVLISKIILS